MVERLGLVAPRAALVAAAVVVVALCAVGLAAALFSSRGVTVSRADASGLAAQAKSGDAGGGSGKEGSGSGASNGASAASGDGQALVVHVDGAVARPGVVEVRGATPRLRDAIEAAGGLAEGADTGSLNLAEKVTDGQKVHVPTVEEVQAGAAGAASGGAAGGGAASGAGAQAAAGSSGAGSGMVNINTATAPELQTLSGVGESTANAIVRDREQNGPFSSVDDLMRVSGIGEKKLAKIRGSICV